MADKLSERLEALAALAEPTDDAERDHNAPDAECVFVDTRPAEFEALLREAAELARRCEWQPIETAPKDGSEFLSVANYTDEPRQVQIVDWDFVQQCQPGLYTHWMPLPEPPEAG